MNERYLRIKKKIISSLAPEFLRIRDDSNLHASHGNVKKGELETHFNIKIVSTFFKHKNKVDMHKMVYEILNDEFSSGLHSLELDLKEKINDK
tara:strand:- start:151 stop:429 length:279 start_codon:yes stop_codon:yes gene_type:complete